jgi:hypothetical protein
VDKLKGLVKEREGQIRSAVDKAGEFVDDKTKGKYHDKIAKAGEKADQVITKATADGAPASKSEPTGPTGPTADATTETSATDTASQPTSEAKEAADKPADAAKDAPKDTDKGAAE